MRSRLLALPASLLLAGVALAQNPPNAIGIWHSFGVPPGTFTIGGVTDNIVDGTTGVSAWKSLSCEVTNYFTSIGSGSVRQLRFRGVDFYAALVQASTGSPSAIPQVDIMAGQASTNPALAGHFRPNFTTPTTYASFPGALWGVNPLGAPVFFHYVLGAPVNVPSGAPAGSAVCAVFRDYFKTGTGVFQKTWILMTANEDVAVTATASNDYSGVTHPTAGSIWFAGLTEYAVSFLFDESMIAPIKNAKVATAGDILPGTATPGTYPAIFAPIFCDDGKGAMRQEGNDSLSYMGNSNTVNPPTINAPWLVPFTLFSGDIGGGPLPDPAPENWVDDGGIVQNAWIHPMSEQKYLDDLAFAFSQAPIGALIDPGNHTLGLYLGIDLIPPATFSGFLNINALLNGISLADISTAGNWAGPELLRYDSAVNPGGFIAINLANLGAKTAEVKHPVTPSVGWTPFHALPNGMSGIVTIPLTPLFTGNSYFINCWALDTASTGGFFGLKISNLTNVVRIQL